MNNSTIAESGEKLLTTRNLVMCAVLTALTAVLSQLSIPLPSQIPITLQTFAVALCGYMLGSRLGSVSLIVYALLGAVGVPVFASFSGGLGAIAGYTGGYIIGFIPMAFLCGLGTELNNKALLAVLSLAGLAVCHLLGTIWFSIVSGTSLLSSFMVASVPYLVKDIVSVVCAYFIALAVKKALRKARLGTAD
ncbi:MAG: biotin transporter BioY [Oscillospiraceae bacterium]|nr:biotin transporter BioY [Oscillospiraceae bacterium]